MKPCAIHPSVWLQDNEECHRCIEALKPAPTADVHVPGLPTLRQPIAPRKPDPGHCPDCGGRTIRGPESEHCPTCGWGALHKPIAAGTLDDEILDPTRTGDLSRPFFAELKEIDAILAEANAPVSADALREFQVEQLEAEAARDAGEEDDPPPLAMHPPPPTVHFTPWDGAHCACHDPGGPTTTVTELVTCPACLDVMARIQETARAAEQDAALGMAFDSPGPVSMAHRRRGDVPDPSTVPPESTDRRALVVAILRRHLGVADGDMDLDRFNTDAIADEILRALE